MAPRVQEVALRLSRAIKTGRDLQDPVVNATQEQIAKNRQHQQTYQKQLQVLCPLYVFVKGAVFGW